MPSLLLRWIVGGILEILISLLLATIAPSLINSVYPWLGFFLWLIILALWLGSALYVVVVVQEAHRVRKFFLRHFPEESDRSLFDFTGLSLNQAKQRLAEWQDLSTDEGFRTIDISPLEFMTYSPRSQHHSSR